MYAAAVERNWFQHYLGGKPRQEITGNARGDDPSWDVATGQTIDGVIAEFESACAASRQIAAAFALDQTVPHDQLGQVSLRFIYVNIITEHARPPGTPTSSGSRSTVPDEAHHLQALSDSP